MSHRGTSADKGCPAMTPPQLLPTRTTDLHPATSRPRSNSTQRTQRGTSTHNRNPLDHWDVAFLGNMRGRLWSLRMVWADTPLSLGACGGPARPTMSNRRRTLIHNKCSSRPCRRQSAMPPDPETRVRGSFARLSVGATAKTHRLRLRAATRLAGLLDQSTAIQPAPP